MKSKDVPLSEITLRKYERPYQTDGRDLVSKLCLSVGLLQPGDSRDVVVDIFMVLLRDKKLSVPQIEKAVIESRKLHKLPLLGIAQSNIRRQLRRLRELYLIQKVASNYRIHENELMSNIYKEKVEHFLLKSIKDRVEEYFKCIDEKFLSKSSSSAAPSPKKEEQASYAVLSGAEYESFQ